MKKSLTLMLQLSLRAGSTSLIAPIHRRLPS